MEENKYYTKYYSKNPNIHGSFDSVEELEAAEQEYKAKVAEEEIKKQTRKEDYELVEKAYQEAAAKQKEANELYAEANALKNDFLKKYGSLHLTIKTPGSNFFSSWFENWLI